MADKLQTFNKKGLKSDIPQIRAGMKVRVWQKIKEGDKERLQAFEGIVISVKHGLGKNGTFTVRKMSGAIGVERIFPFHTPVINKIEILSQSKVRRAKIYYLRGLIGKKSKMKQVALTESVVSEMKEKEVTPVTEEISA